MHIPYPPRATIRGIRWLTERLLYPQSHGDVWSCMWADDDAVYTASDDTHGVGEACDSNLAIHQIVGIPPTHTATTINLMAAYGHLGQREGQDTWKANGRRLWMTIAGHFSQEPGMPFSYGLIVRKCELCLP